MSAPLDAIEGDEGDALVLRRPRRLGEGGRRRGRQRAPALRGVHPGHDHRAAVDALDHRPHRARCLGPESHRRLGHRAAGYCGRLDRSPLLGPRVGGAGPARRVCFGPLAPMTSCRTSATARRRRAEHGAAPSRQPHLAGREIGDRDAREVALQPTGHRGGRHDGRAVALEGEGGHQPDAVDLGLGPQGHPGAPGLGVEVTAQRGAGRRQHERMAGELREAHLASARRAGWPPWPAARAPP